MVRYDGLLNPFHTLNLSCITHSTDSDTYAMVRYDGLLNSFYSLDLTSLTERTEFGILTPEYFFNSNTKNCRH